MKDTHIRKCLEDGLSTLSYTERQHREMLNRIVYGGKRKMKKEVVTKTEWRYNAWFSSPAACYVIEEPIPGYITKYVNVGVYAQITDRCCDGGTIINKKIPKTGDEAPLLLWACCAVIGVAGIATALLIGSKRRKRSK